MGRSQQDLSQLLYETLNTVIFSALNCYFLYTTTLHVLFSPYTTHATTKKQKEITI